MCEQRTLKEFIMKIESWLRAKDVSALLYLKWDFYKPQMQ